MVQKALRWWLPAVVTAVLAGPAFAQLEDNLGALDDETAAGYLQPLQSAFGQALNSNWSSHASIGKNQIHAKVEVRAMSVFFKNDDDLFRATTGGDFTPGQQIDAPTVVGPEESVTVTGDGGTSYTFPGGFNLGSLTIGVPQLTVGGYYGTEATVRWIAVDTGDAELGDLSLFGVGVRHSISQYFPTMPVDLAGGVFYQTFKLGDNLIESDAVSVGVQASRTFGVFTPYGSVSFDSFSMTADYTSDDGAQSREVHLELDTANHLHLAVGAGVGLGPVQLNLGGDLSKRVGVSGGLAVGF